MLMYGQIVGTGVGKGVYAFGLASGSDFEAPDLERGIHFRGVF